MILCTPAKRLFLAPPGSLHHLTRFDLMARECRDQGADYYHGYFHALYAAATVMTHAYSFSFSLRRQIPFMGHVQCKDAG